MCKKFYPMTKWLPTATLLVRQKKVYSQQIDEDLSYWVEHLKKLGYKEGVDFKIRKRSDGKCCLFRRGKTPFGNPPYHRTRPF